MRILLDNDALLKLVRYDLLDAALDALQATRDDVQVLAQSKYVLLPAKDRLKRCKDEASATRLEEFLASAARIDAERIDADALDALTAQPNLDAGEALLLATAATDRDTLVVTGDKRALVALCSDHSLASVQQSLEGRVITLEILFALLTQHEHELVQHQVRSNPDVDRALGNIFGVSSPANRDSVREALLSYINSLREVVGKLLYPLRPNS
ncbi:hypothetical protein ACI2TU_07790 [Ralstonia nicotianae]